MVSAIFNLIFSESMVDTSGDYYDRQSDFYQYQKEIVDQYNITVMSGIRKKALSIFEKKSEAVQRAEGKLLKKHQKAYIPALLNEYLPTIIFLLLLILNKDRISYVEKHWPY